MDLRGLGGEADDGHGGQLGGSSWLRAAAGAGRPGEARSGGATGGFFRVVGHDTISVLISTTIVHIFLNIWIYLPLPGLPATGKLFSFMAVDSIQSNGWSHPDSPCPQSRQHVNPSTLLEYSTAHGRCRI